MTDLTTKSSNLIIGLGILFAIWGIFGLLDIKNNTFDGYSTDGNNTIVEVEDGSPASAAGMQIGDVIKSTGGIAVDDTKALNKRQRAKIGDTREFVVDRNGDEIIYGLTYAGQTSKGKALNYLGWIIGLIYLLMAVWSFLKKKNNASYLFALFGLGFGFSFLGGPYIANPTVRNIIGSIGLSIVLFSFAFLLNFILSFPKRSAFLDKKNSITIIYGPALLLSLFFIILTIILPDSSSGLNVTIRYLVGLFILFYFGWALIALIRSYMKASSEERSASGLNLMFWGAIIGLLPILLIILINTVAPAMIIPGSDYVFLTMALIPICFGLAVMKENRREG